MTLYGAQPAGASTVAVEENELRFTAAAGELNKATVTDTGTALEVRDSGAAVTAGAGCSATNEGAICERGAVQRVRADLGDGEDTFDLTGNLPATVDGGPGDDIVRPGGGNDLVNAGPGNDTAQGAGGVDRLHGADGADSLDGGAGNDLLDGGTGPDTLTAGDGGDSLLGGDGDDQLEAGKGADSLDGGAGNDRLLTAEGEFSGDRETQIFCGPGTDSARVGPADWFVTDCEVMDGASIRVARRNVVPLVIVCPAACRLTARISGRAGHIAGARRFSAAAGKPTRVNIRLSRAETRLLFRLRKVRMTFRVGGTRATFTLLRRI